MMLGVSAPVCMRAQESRAADEAAMRESVKQMESGWNTKSGALFAKPFAEDADYVVINGMYIKGRAMIETSHQQIFDTIFKDTNDQSQRQTDPVSATRCCCGPRNGHRDGPTKELIQDAILTLVMTKEKQGWTIAAFQNTAVVSRQ